MSGRKTIVRYFKPKEIVSLTVNRNFSAENLVLKRLYSSSQNGEI